MRPLLAIGAAMLSMSAASAQAPTEKGRLGIALTEIIKPWTGDLSGMVERRMVRVLTTYSKTQYFIDRGTPRGTAYDQGKLLEDELNKTLVKGNLKINVQFVPLSRNELLPALVEGKGDIVMADLTVTPERAKTVDFVDSWISGVDEIVVTGPRGSGDHLRRRSLTQRSVRQRVEQLLREPAETE
jgi:ABC-type amino acid transport substrate-binding protein